jgi:hypothetical protein
MNFSRVRAGRNPGKWRPVSGSKGVRNATNSVYRIANDDSGRPGQEGVLMFRCTYLSKPVEGSKRGEEDQLANFAR